MKEKTQRGKKETFLIRGKVAAEEAARSLEGLKVMAYVAGTRKLVGTAITDEKGSFSIEFEYHEPVDVSVSVCPEVEEGRLRLMPKARHTISKDAWVKKNPYFMDVGELVVQKSLFLLWESICKTYTVFGLVVKGTPDPDNPGSYLELTPIPDATVHIYDIDPAWPWLIWPPPPLSYTKYEIGTATTDENGLFLFEFEWCYTTPFIHPWWWPPFPDTKPDILFRVTQTVDSVEVPIYEEDPASETRWNIDELPPLGVTLITEEGILPDDPIDPIAGDFEFHGIGRVLISQIDSEGYADTSGPGDVVGARDSPFGSTVDIKGQFNNALAGLYYQVLYAKWPDDVTPPDAGDFTPILGEQWPIAQKIGSEWVTVMKAPLSLPGAGDGCYEIPDYTDLWISSKEILIRWTTHRGKNLDVPVYPNGKYTLMARVFEGDGTPVSLPAGGDLELIVRVDNTWPVASIKEDITVLGGIIPICPDPRPPGMVCDNPEVCGIIYIEPGKSVRVKFDAYDEQNHFRRYHLTYRTGHGVALPIADENFTGPPREDYGFLNETADWDISSLDQCGYQIRLVVWDRTINGYHHIHWSEDFIHLILLEAPAP